MQKGFFTDREIEIVRVALSFAGANIDDINESLGFCDKDDDRLKEEEVFSLFGKFNKE